MSFMSSLNPSVRSIHPRLWARVDDSVGASQYRRLAPWVAAGLLACGGTDSTQVSGDGAVVPPAVVLPEPSPPSDDSAVSGGALYAVAIDVLTDDNRTGYVSAVASLDRGSVAGLDAAIEFPGGVSIFGGTEQGRFYAAPFESPVIERWRLDGAGQFEREQTV